MSLPDWRASDAGTRTRVALWLASEVGVGGVFTKADLRAAFEGVEQVDRRMRDLRAEGWVIATNREDVTLAPEQLRLQAMGGAVWEPGYESRAPKVPTAKERQAVLAAADYLCRFCGITAGDSYPEDPLRRAKLGAARVSRPGGSAGLECLCDRCLGSLRNGTIAASAVDEVRALSAEDRATLRVWVGVEERGSSALERAWALYRRASDAERNEIRAMLQAD
ncbi:HNH endonuclease [Paraconexibacter algicola]|uniref:HNH endonuclease n=1 Tax=Paraconexibacter algicola TaxID=2133960 RepID=A0A2T4ULG3_9ACTN|nr:HNH endonuclease [Paraconexibacter algicola]PTL60060.1 HNH endonuclease [Paraconexibacter algicola]